MPQPADRASRCISIASHIELNRRLTCAILLSPNDALSNSSNASNWNSRSNSTWALKALDFKAGA